MHFFPTTIVNDYSKYKRETGYPSREKGMQKGKYFVSDKNTQSNVKIMITMMMITMMMMMLQPAADTHQSPGEPVLSHSELLDRGGVCHHHR